jgi:hypothetical protein
MSASLVAPRDSQPTVAALSNKPTIDSWELSMNENAKTLTFVVVAAVAVLLAVVTRPHLPVAAPENASGQPLYPDFKDPLAVASLEIVEFDEATASVRPFQVARLEVKGKTRWVIPSHDDYPADAKDQVASAAAGLMELKPLEMVSEDLGAQQEYGVIQPDPKTLKVGATGVGTEVIMKDSAGKELLALVIGKEVPGRPGLRYVRKVNQAPIYVVEAKTDKLSTKFENWIERNLLQINTFDMKQVQIRDYALKNYGGSLAIVQRSKMQVDYSDTGEPKWKLVDDQKFVPDEQSPEGGRWAPVKMADNEEVNAAKMDELKTALDDLKIIDISRKPAGLSTDLKVAGEFAKNREGLESLADKGFLVGELVKGQPEIFSNEGEFRVVMKDGVEYVLRFGEIAGAGPSKSDEKPKDAKNEADKDKEKKGSGLNRYLFVMAEFNGGILPKPQFETLPEAKKDAQQKPVDETKTDEAKPEDKKPEEGKADEKKPDEKAGEANKTDEKKADEKKPDEKKTEEAARQRIEKENKRKQDEYDQKLADGKKHVADLNARFADWYYVISEEVYRKIHLGRDDIVKKKEPPKTPGDEKKDEHAGHDHDEMPKEPALPSEELEKLKAEGLKGEK